MLYKSNLKEEDIKDSFWIYIPKIIAFIHQYVQPLDNSPQFGSYNVSYSSVDIKEYNILNCRIIIGRKL